ncbi:dienelactone hydrolase family protein [Luteolibacter sp. LG18]|uniref:dienelactone hydrolase family protein n=1 Tax=Luteolibacter sp. LG18 TaxID=2819286 RepID=UPI002B294B9B|nr:dienelactone hydrolase [Luteolibacter sp. LG18]
MTRHLLSVLAATASLVSAELVEKPVMYEQGGVKLEGFHVYDDAITGPRPGILVIHQWTGLSDHEKEQSRKLAKLGYNVLAADVYGQGIRPKPPEAGKEAGKYKADRQLLRERLYAGLETLKKDERTDSSRLGAIGYCFGGLGVLELARAEVDLKGVVSFHGSLDAAEGLAAKKGTVKAKVLVLHGADDPHAPAAQVEALKKEMADAGADCRVVLYPGAVHSFTQKSAGNDPSKGSAYNEAADTGSWKEMTEFFAGLFKK